MRWRGLEPPRPCGHKALNFARDCAVCPIRSTNRLGARGFDRLERLERLAATTTRVGCYRVHPSVDGWRGPRMLIRPTASPRSRPGQALGRRARPRAVLLRRRVVAVRDDHCDSWPRRVASRRAPRSRSTRLVSGTSEKELRRTVTTGRRYRENAACADRLVEHEDRCLLGRIRCRRIRRVISRPRQRCCRLDRGLRRPGPAQPPPAPNREAVLRATWSVAT